VSIAEDGDLVEVDNRDFLKDFAIFFDDDLVSRFVEHGTLAGNV